MCVYGNPQVDVIIAIDNGNISAFITVFGKILHLKTLYSPLYLCCEVVRSWGWTKCMCLTRIGKLPVGQVLTLQVFGGEIILDRKSLTGFLQSKPIHCVVVSSAIFNFILRHIRSSTYRRITLKIHPKSRLVLVKQHYRNHVLSTFSSWSMVEVGSYTTL